MVVRAVAIVTAADTDAGAAQARAVAPLESTRAVVLCGSDAASLGALAAELRAQTQVAVFCGDAASDPASLDELILELFDDRESLA